MKFAKRCEIARRTRDSIGEAFSITWLRWPIFARNGQIFLQLSSTAQRQCKSKWLQVLQGNRVLKMISVETIKQEQDAIRAEDARRANEEAERLAEAKREEQHPDFLRLAALLYEGNSPRETAEVTRRLGITDPAILRQITSAIGHWKALEKWFPIQNRVRKELEELKQKSSDFEKFVTDERRRLAKARDELRAGLKIIDQRHKKLHCENNIIGQLFETTPHGPVLHGRPNVWGQQPPDDA